MTLIALRAVLAQTVKERKHWRGLAQELQKRVDQLEILHKEAVSENDKLRGIIAWSAMPCIYCGLSLGDQAQCASGFPGCGRADDQMVYNPNKCTLGVGCDEMGKCYAAAHGKPEECGRPS